MTRPLPRLFRRLLRSRARYVLLLTLALLTLRLAWGFEAHRRLEQTRTALRAAGFTIDRDAYLDAPIPDNQNAIIPLLHALKNYPLTNDESNFLTEGSPPQHDKPVTFPPPQLVDVDALLQRLAPNFADLDAAATRPATAWPPELFTRDENVLEALGYYNALPLVDVLEIAALRAHDRGDTHEVLHRLFNILALSRLMDTLPTIHGNALSTMIRSDAAICAERNVLDLPYTAETLPAVRQIIITLADTSTTDLALVRSCEAELTFPLDHRYLRLPFPDDSWLLGPLMTDETERALRLQARSAAAARLRYPEIKRTLLFPTGDQTILDTLAHSVSRDNVLKSKWFQLHAMRTVDSRAVAVLLAAECFRQQHHAYPPNLAALSEYFPATPLDPFSPDNLPLNYRLDPAGPTVWSVGENGADDGGAPPAPSVTGRVRRFSQSDFVYGAARRSAVPTPSSSTAPALPTPPPTPPPPATPPPTPQL